MPWYVSDALNVYQPIYRGNQLTPTHPCTYSFTATFCYSPRPSSPSIPPFLPYFLLLFTFSFTPRIIPLISPVPTYSISRFLLPSYHSRIFPSLLLRSLSPFFTPLPSRSPLLSPISNPLLILLYPYYLSLHPPPQSISLHSSLPFLPFLYYFHFPFPPHSLPLPPSSSPSLPRLPFHVLTHIEKYYHPISPCKLPLAGCKMCVKWTRSELHRQANGQ